MATETLKFDIYFNFNAEDHYLVEYLSQHLRHHGLTTFDRSVDQLPDEAAEACSEADALAESRMMVAVLTENSVEDPAFQDMVSRCIEERKPIAVMRYDDALIPSRIVDDLIIECSREDLKPSLRELDAILQRLDIENK